MQRDFLRIARECRDRGHEVHVYTMSWDGEAEPGFHVHLIKPSGMQNYARISSFVNQLQSLLKRGHYDRVIGFNKMPGLDFYYAADVCFQKRAHEKHGWLSRLLPRYKKLTELERQVFARGVSTHILAISPFTQAEFSAYYQTEPTRFHLLPPGIAPDRLAPANASEIRARVRAEHQLGTDDLLLLMVGSGFKTKGLDRSINALAALPENLRARSHLFVIGQDNAETFRRQAEKLGVADRVRFLGGRADVAAFYLAADVLLHPAYHENTGTVLLEALAAGLPVIVTDVCGYAHYIQSAEAGVVLSSPFEQAEFNKVVATALASDRTQWQANGLAFARSTDIYSMPVKAVNIIEQTVLNEPTIELSFDEMMRLEGENFREQPGRQTFRVKLGEQHYFIKKHYGVGWREIFKNLLQLKKPVLGARNERLAIEKLSSLGVAVPGVIAYSERGCNPARRQSYILLQELAPVVSLEQLIEKWRTTPPSPVFKRQLIKEVARIARVMHDNGVNHRDFYLCHFLLDTSIVDSKAPTLYLIDLHRAEIRQILPERWRIKDLAGLYFSSINSGLTQRDYWRFIRHYRNKPLREVIACENQRWRKVKQRGEQLYREHN